MVSFDVKALFYERLCRQSHGNSKARDNVANDDLPMPKEDFMVIHLCVSFNVVQFDGRNINKSRCWLWGSLLRAALAVFKWKQWTRNIIKTLWETIVPV